jgi:DNA-directed RNA polymerase subunit RPC12/RpoP
MTSPPIRIEVVCPQCGTTFSDYYRPSINLSLGEEWSEEALEEATMVRCPQCGFTADPGTLLVEMGGEELEPS